MTDGREFPVYLTLDETNYIRRTLPSGKAVEIGKILGKLAVAVAREEAARAKRGGGAKKKPVPFDYTYAEGKEDSDG